MTAVPKPLPVQGRLDLVFSPLARPGIPATPATSATSATPASTTPRRRAVLAPAVAPAEAPSPRARLVPAQRIEAAAPRPLIKLSTLPLPPEAADATERPALRVECLPSRREVIVQICGTFLLAVSVLFAAAYLG